MKYLVLLFSFFSFALLPVAQGQQKLPPNSGILYFGDSQTAFAYSATGNAVQYQNYGYAAWVNAMAPGVQTPKGGILGVPGETTTQMLNRLSAISAFGAKFFVVLAGTNDPLYAISAETTKANLRKIYDAGIANGMKVIAICIMPRFAPNTYDATTEANRIGINNWIKSQTDITVIDAEAELNAPENFEDGLHNSPLGAYKLGNKVAAAINKMVFACTPGSQNAADLSRSANSNPLLTGTTGKLNTATGSVANSWELHAGFAGGATVVGSKETDADGKERQVINVSGSYTGNTSRVTFNNYAAVPISLAAGDVVEGIAEIEIPSAMTNIRGIYLKVIAYTSGYATILSDGCSMFPTSNKPLNIPAGKYILRTPAMTIDAGTVGQLTTQVMIELNGTTAAVPVAAVIKLSSAGVRRLPLANGPLSTIIPGGTVAVCPGATQVLTANAGTGYSFQWKLDGTNIPAANAATYSATNTGAYNVLVTVPGCSVLSDTTFIVAASCNANAITTGTVAAKLCAGQAVDVPYNVSNAFAAGNVFTAQLSDATGSFANPVAIGSLATTGAGTIKATIPAGTTQGTGYRIRIISSTPAATGTDNGVNISVYSVPVLTSTLNPSAVCNNSLFSYTPTVSPSGTTYTWSRAAVTGISNAAATGTSNISETLQNISTALVSANYIFNLSNNGCANSSPYTVVAAVNPSPIARTKNITVNLDATKTATITPQQIDNGSTGSCGALQYSLDKTQFTCANIGANTVSLVVKDAAGNTSTATATVTVTDANGVCNANAITTGSIAAKLCAGQAVDVSYTVSNAFGASNVFTAQLSDVNGSFTSPVAIGTLATPGAGVIKATIPASTAQGTSFRIRVISSSPVSTGTDNGAAIAIYAVPVFTSTLAPSAICNNSIFAYTPTGTPAGTVFSWSRAIVSGISNLASSGVGSISETLQNTTASPINVSYVYTLSNNGCTNTNAYTVVVAVNPSPVARTKTISVNLDATKTAIITPQQVDNGSTGSCGTLQYSLDKTQFSCVNIGTNTVTLTVKDAAGNTSSATTTVTVTDVNGVCNANTITTGNIAAKLCAGSPVSVPFTLSNIFGSGNVFTAQLSDANGSFANPVAIGTLASTSAGTIQATIPSATPQGTGYRIRVVSSNPVATGSDNGAAIAIYSVPVLTSTVTPSAICNNSVFNYTPTANPAGTTFSWTRAAVSGISNAAASGTGGVSEILRNTTAASVNASYVYQLSNNSCNSNAYTVVVAVNPSPVALTKNISVNLGATGTVTITPQQVDNGSKGSCGTLQYNLDKTQFACANIGANTVTLTVTDGAGNTSSATATVTVTDVNNVCNPNTISTGSVAAKLCAGQAVDISYSVSNAFGSTNVFTAQLSDAAGSFTSPIAIGSLTATGAGTIKATIPASAAQGTGYRIRVVSSSPAATGSDNGTNIGIYSVPVFTSTLTPSAICNNGLFTYTPTATPAGTSFSWSRASVAGISNAVAAGTGSVSEMLQNTTTAPVNVSYVYTLSNNGCISGNSYTVVVAVNPSPLAKTKNISVNLDATKTVTITPQQVDNGSAGSCGTLQYSLDKTQFTCANIGINTVTLTVKDANGNTSAATATVTVTDINGVCNANAITTGSVGVKFCSGQLVDVPYSVSNAFGSGNVFTAQLSNATGSFTSPVNIGTLATTGAGTIKATIPTGTTQGTGYRIRVISSTPAATGTDNGTNLSIYEIPVITSSLTPAAICNNAVFNYTPSGTPSTTVFNWSRAVVSGISNAAATGTGNVSEPLQNTTTAAIKAGYTYTLNNNGCTSTSPYNVVVSVNPSPVARTKNITVNLDATGNATITPQQVDNGSTGSCGTLQYSLSKSGFTCANIGANTVTLTVKDAGGNTSVAAATVTVTDTNGPSIANASASPSVLWPALQNMVTVNINYILSENCGAATATLSVTSNEAERGVFHGDKKDDWNVLSANSVQLRAERNPSGTGRVYTITITAKDARGNTTTKDVIVTCPILQPLLKTSTTDRNQNATTMEEEAETADGLVVSVRPNPSPAYFTLVTQSNSSKPVLLRVLDAMGRLVETKANVSANGTITIGQSFRPGTYFVEAVQGNKRVTLRLHKLSE